MKNNLFSSTTTTLILVVSLVVCINLTNGSPNGQDELVGEDDGDDGDGNSSGGGTNWTVQFAGPISSGEIIVLLTFFIPSILIVLIAWCLHHCKSMICKSQDNNNESMSLMNVNRGHGSAVNGQDGGCHRNKFSLIWSTNCSSVLYPLTTAGHSNGQRHDNQGQTKVKIEDTRTGQGIGNSQTGHSPGHNSLSNNNHSQNYNSLNYHTNYTSSYNNHDYDTDYNSQYNNWNGKYQQKQQHKQQLHFDDEKPPSYQQAIQMEQF